MHLFFENKKSFVQYYILMRKFNLLYPNLKPVTMD